MITILLMKLILVPDDTLVILTTLVWSLSSLTQLYSNKPSLRKVTQVIPKEYDIVWRNRHDLSVLVILGNILRTKEISDWRTRKKYFFYLSPIYKRGNFGASSNYAVSPAVLPCSRTSRHLSMKLLFLDSGGHQYGEFPSPCFLSFK